MRLPGKYNKSWLTVFAGYTLLSWGLLAVARWSVSGQQLLQRNSLALLVYCAIVSAIASLFGFLGAVYVFICTVAGTLVGTVVSTIMSRGKSGWEDLILLILQMEFIVGGFVIGILVEAFVWLFRKLRARDR